MFQYFKIGTADISCLEFDSGVVSAYDVDNNLLSATQRDQILPGGSMVKRTARNVTETQLSIQSFEFLQDKRISSIRFTVMLRYLNRQKQRASRLYNVLEMPVTVNFRNCRTTSFEARNPDQPGRVTAVPGRATTVSEKELH